MKVSIITVTFNSQDTISETISSVYNQDYNNIEYIIIDGKSSGNTVDIVKVWEKKFNYKNKQFAYITEKDNGVYDALNKGILLATGDIIGFLNSDDYFISKKIVNKIVNEFQMSSLDCLFGDLIFINPNDRKAVRKWASKDFAFGLFQKSWSRQHIQHFIVKEKYAID